MPIAPFSHPVYVMAKPAGAACNLRCAYCYYLDTSPRSEAPVSMMSDALLEEFVRQYIEMQTTDSVLFTWHGGEPTLRGLDFYRRVVQLQRRWAGSRHVDNALQTNGTLLTADWCRFLHDEQWLVGISLDGPQHLHDAYRRNAQGRPTHAAVMRGVELCQRFGVEWNAMATVNRATAAEPLAFYRFFRDNGCRYLQFTPVVERVAGQVTSWSVTPEAWGAFLCAVFDEWWRRDVGTMFVQLFESTLAGWVGMTPGVCTMGRSCGHAAIIEADGAVYSCDHFATAEHRLGYLSAETTLLGMMHSEKQRAFGMQKTAALTAECRRCPWLRLCNGECPRTRFALSADGQAGHSYLCGGYRRYFAHTATAMRMLAAEM